MMTPEIEAEFRKHAEDEFPRECCGVVIVTKGKARYVRITNVAKTNQEHFVTDGAEMLAAEQAGDIVAFCHSHPNASPQPSAADKVQCEVHGWPWYIVSVGAEGAETLVSFEPTGYEAPLVGRPFTHGVLDCYALVRDYYAREMGVDLPDYERRDDWWSHGQNLYVDNFEKHGFERIDPDVDGIQVGDVILMNVRSEVPNHAAVYIGDGMILHHFVARLSTREVYGGQWKHLTTMVVRKTK